MSEKATGTVAKEDTSRSRAIKPDGRPSTRLASENPFCGLQQTLGNQAMLQLLESGAIQGKLRVSQPGDPDEVEADRVAEKVVSSSRAPAIQRKCDCEGGIPCSKCTSEEETIHRNVATARLRSPQPVIQRATADSSSTPDTTPAPATPEKQPAPGAKPGALVVEDNAAKVEPHQMRKSQFIALLRTEACAAADAALASVNHTTKGCPYVAKWLSFYEKQSSQHIEQAIRKYAPEAATARSAREVISTVVMRVERAALQWAKTGRVEGVPKELASQFPGQSGVLGAVHDFASTKVGGAILGFIGGTKNQERAGGGEVQRKARDPEPAPARDATAVKTQLGNGHSLDSRVQSQMSSAFGHDFSGVRVHTDSSAARLSSDLQARAFTVGNDVAFASGEYRPGTLIGDVLIAHELAHVVQQGGGKTSPQTKSTAHGDDSRLEQDADRSAVGAMFSTWTGIRTGMALLGASALPRLKSDLKLQRCDSKSTPSTSAPAWTPDELKRNLSNCDGGTGAGAGAARVSVQIGDVSAGSRGQVDVSRGVITLIAGQDKCTATQTLIQEVTNYSHKADFDRIDASAAAGDLSRLDYIRQTEQVEFDGVHKVIQAFDACKTTWVCTTCAKEWARAYATFDDYYNRGLSNTHKEYYGQSWDRLYKAAYDAKHPPAHAHDAGPH